MDVYEAVNLARSYTELKEPFQISFIKHDQGKPTGEVRTIEKALLRKANRSDKNRNCKLFLYDVQSQENRSCWIPLLLSVNKIKVKTI